MTDLDGVFTVLSIVAVMAAIPVVGVLARRGRRKGYRGPFLLAALVVVALGLWIAGGFAVQLVPLPRRLEGAELVPSVVPALLGCWLLVACLPQRREPPEPVRRARFPFRLLAATSAAGGLLGFVAFLADGRTREAVYVLGIGLILCGLSLLPVRRSRTLQLASVDELPPEASIVLLLRGFREERVPFSTSDARRAPAGWVRWLTVVAFGDNPPVERYLGAAVSARLGVLIGLGDPGDYLPPSDGMFRSYPVDSDWPTVVATIVPRARAVLLVAGRASRSFSWELDHLHRGGHHGKTFLVLPRYPPPGERGAPRYLHLNARLRGARPARWAEVVAGFEAEGWRVPTDYPGPASVIGFDTTGRGRVLVSGANSAQDIVEVVARHLPDR